MPNESLHVDRHHERLDADAVCERCGTVNPEDTLLCKSCGNNLRDQRMRRIAEGADFQAVAPRAFRWSTLASLLTVLGLLLLVWTVWNLDAISQGLFSGDETGETAEQLWVGPQHQVYDDLKAELAANPVSDADAERARTSPIPVTDFTGRFVITNPSIVGTSRRIGTGVARQEGGVVYFVATLELDGAEIRGEAQLVGDSIPRVSDTAAIFANGEYTLASGVALRNPDAGGYVCHAQTMYSNPVSVQIFKVP